MRRFRLRLKVLCILILGVLFFTVFIHYALVGGSSQANTENKDPGYHIKRSHPVVLSTPDDAYHAISSYIMDEDITPAASKRKAFEFNAYCPAVSSSAPQVDIQMGKVYSDEIKFDNLPGGKWTQGWNIGLDLDYETNPENMLQVFVMPHSHNDPGWKSTFESYYAQSTKGILDSMVTKLLENEKRKFIWAEVSFLSLWWKDISEDTKDKVRMLVKSGQLEIVTGGWVMTDEANSHYYSMIQELTHGQQWLLNNIGVKPRHSWCIDPFGMSPTMPLLLKQAGLEALLGQRSHYEVKKFLAQERNLEFRWRQLWDNSGNTDLLTHMMPFYSYDIPHTCGPDPSVCCQFDFRRLQSFQSARRTCPWGIQPQVITDNNVAHRAELLLDQWRKKAFLYKTRVLLVPLGDDFRYENLAEWDAQMINYEKLFAHMNSRASLNVHASFGTLADYFDTLRKTQESEGFPTLSGDFFTYADKDDNYWSGYYTSRPFYKRMDRELSGLLRAADLLFTLAWRGSDVSKDWLLHGSGCLPALSEARSSLSLFQHHDGVTGTAKDNVVQDYAEKMWHSILALRRVMDIAANVLLAPDSTSELTPLGSYPESKSSGTLGSLRKFPNNAEVIDIGSDDQRECAKQVVLFNPLSWERKELVSVKVSSDQVTISLPGSSEPVISQVVPVCITTTGLSPCYQLYFVANLAPFQLKSYCLSYAGNRTKSYNMSQMKVYNTQHHLNHKFKQDFSSYITNSPLKSFNFQTSRISVSFNDKGFMKSITDKDTRLTTPLNLNFVEYTSRDGREMSGAYLFLPRGEAKAVPVVNAPVLVVQGPLLSMVSVQVAHLTHTVIVNHVSDSDELGVDIQNLLDIRQTVNTEVAMRFSSNIGNQNVFYTDLNGYQMIKRKHLDKIPLQGNFYPMPTAAYIEDSSKRLTILSAQSLGMSSLRSGEIEILQDRRLNQDDERGLGQGVLDNVPTLTLFRVLLESRQANCKETQESSHPAGFLSAQAHLSLESLTSPILPISTMEKETSAVTGNKVTEYTPLESGPGLDVHVVSLTTLHVKGEQHAAGIVLRRLRFDSCYAVPRQRSFSGDEIPMSLVLPLSGDDTLYRSSLTFLDIDKKKPLSKSVAVCSMDLAAFYLQSSSSTR
uniref:Alpha-mannosidase n=1 Tax=Cacopsylla melanoneura TaxID=428564 RepID=A0A8D9DRT5_9HEMI